jgi:hypothetical protein
MLRGVRDNRRGGRDLGECREAARLLQSYLDGEVSPAARIRVEQHLEVCRRCSLEARTYAKIKAALARWGGPADELLLLRLRQFGVSLVASGHPTERGR